MMPAEKKTKNKLSNVDDWVDLYGDYLYRFALSRIRNPQDAENAVQETFLAALKARKSFSGRSTERTWLIGILKHKMIDYFRKRYREIPVTNLQNEQEQMTIDSFFDQTEYPLKYPTNWSANPRELSENQEFWVVFEKCLSKLPETTALAFTLREIDKMKTEEICKILSITPTNLWVMLHRARLQMRTCLEQNWFERNL
ncbi:MAG: sigma-70 family RNA polymerase sigma factor [Candidatus Omnitrophota bacterium]